jgi:hypothetical protein
MLSAADISDMSPECRHFGRFFLVERVVLFSDVGRSEASGRAIAIGRPPEWQEIVLAKPPGGMSEH